MVKCRIKWLNKENRKILLNKRAKEGRTANQPRNAEKEGDKPKNPFGEDMNGDIKIGKLLCDEDIITTDN